MLGFFVLADHIETAVRYVFWLVVLIWFAVGLTLATERMNALLVGIRLKHPRMFAVVLGPLLLLGLLYFLLRTIGPLKDWPEQGAAVADICVLVVMALSMPAAMSMTSNPKRIDSSRAGWLEIKKNPLLAAATLWIFGTAAVAILNGLNAMNLTAQPPATTQDIVVLENHRELKGKLIRVLDKGVILFDWWTDASSSFRRNGFTE